MLIANVRETLGSIRRQKRRASGRLESFMAGVGE
jgi:hypothetical protein